MDKLGGMKHKYCGTGVFRHFSEQVWRSETKIYAVMTYAIVVTAISGINLDLWFYLCNTLFALVKVGS